MVRVIREYHYIRSEQQKLKETGYAAISFTDHFIYSGIKANGTEDFSLERYQSQVVRRVIYRPTGRLYECGKKDGGSSEPSGLEAPATAAS